MIVSRSTEVIASSCLVCGALSPSLAEARGRNRGSLAQLLHELGWYSWRSGQPAQLSCLCPECQQRPDEVARSIIGRQGLAPMVEWLRGWKAAAN